MAEAHGFAPTPSKRFHLTKPQNSPKLDPNPNESPWMEQLPNPPRATIHRLTLGQAQVITLLDGAQPRDSINPPFLMDKSPFEIETIAKDQNLAPGSFENSYTPTLIHLNGQVILIDTGLGAAGRGAHAGQLKTRLTEAGFAPTDVDIVAFTHCHPDHIAGVLEDGVPTFANARYVIGRREFDAWADGTEIPPQRAQNRELFLRTIAPLAPRMTFLEDTQTVVSGLVSQTAFGHSLGHMMYRLESDGQALLIWGDVTNHFVYSLQFPDSPVAFDDDQEAAKETRKRVLDMVVTDRLLVSGHHMPFPALGHVERTAGQYRWIPF
ncbi:MAG TPA: MBL fold metallo-hydrolase [Rhodobacter sp.]|jgi:glyoxylase-like metal-dependent hydrolase (beta-lactamase superfamily II)|nr:MAG: hypothetical protein ABR89_05635 [Rhodobacter sp. BACL10 MAG-120910-bin24]MDP5331853.1 MBL fold metallo-hydrolase [Paracoccaceae bacterium]HAG26595.1 MBL fold metallo-hydrolase [Rhodobacter sp.]